jgi:hypothetical protein
MTGYRKEERIEIIAIDFRLETSGHPNRSKHDTLLGTHFLSRITLSIPNPVQNHRFLTPAQPTQ